MSKKNISLIISCVFFGIASLPSRIDVSKDFESIEGFYYDENLSEKVTCGTGEITMFNMPLLDETDKEYFEITSGVKTIGFSLFNYCEALENLTIPDTIENCNGKICDLCDATKLKIYAPKSKKEFFEKPCYN